MEYKIERMETPKIVNYLKADPTVWNLGVLLALQTGLRVGELAALKRNVCHIDQSINLEKHIAQCLSMRDVKIL